jgi:catechol 2,3-dioxygenase-like lactoylglutathione lyase family enzyme
MALRPAFGWLQTAHQDQSPNHSIINRNCVNLSIVAIVRNIGAVALAAAVIGAAHARPLAQPASLPTPGFHHLHLNSVDPDAAIAFYAKQFPSTSASTFAGQPALRSPNNVWVLFTKVDTPPATQPHTAFWHFGWHVTDVRKSLERFRQNNVTLLPLYTGDGGRTVFINSDTWPGTGGVLGLTLEGVAEAKAKGVKPNGGAGFAYLRGPDDALVEYQGNMPAERFNHVHMFQDQPFCAQLWYEKHLNVAPGGRGGQTRTEADCRVNRSPAKTLPALEWDGMHRTPSVTSTRFGDVSFFWYMNQRDTPAAPTRGQLMDHVALSVADLDAWLEKLTAAKVTVLEKGYSVGGLRAIMIEGPSREAIELIEVR